MEKRIEVRSLDTFTEAEEAGLRALRARIDFGVPDYAWTPWAQKKYHVMSYQDGELVCHVGFLVREVGVGERTVKVGGVNTVMTAPEARGRGYAAEAMRLAEEYMRSELGVDFGLLLCLDRMVPYYRSLGWQLVEDQVVFDQPTGRTVSALNAMVLPVRGAEWPKGTLDFRGPPW